MSKKPCKIQIMKHQISPENDTFFLYVRTRWRVTTQVLRPVCSYEKTSTIRSPRGSVIPGPQKSKNSECQTPNACSYKKKTKDRQRTIKENFLTLFLPLFHFQAQCLLDHCSTPFTDFSTDNFVSVLPSGSINAFLTKGISLSYCSSLLFSADSFISPSFS